MGIVEVLLIAIGVSMDAFAVSVAKGISARQMKMRYALQAGLWFGGFQALMPLIEEAAELCEQADILVVIGTSLNVYPAAGLTRCVKPGTPIWLIDPKPVQWNASGAFRHLQMGASRGVAQMMKEVLEIQ